MLMAAIGTQLVSALMAAVGVSVNGGCRCQC